MARDGSGNYSLPAGNPVVSNTLIEANWANPTMSDIAQALTDSLSRTGLGGMLVAFKNADGTIGAPGMSWTNEPSSGWYRKANNQFWYAVNGADIFAITAAGITLATGKTAVGISSFINVIDTLPPAMKQGESWWESDTGLYAMRYINPDLTETLVALAAAGGDFIPYPLRGIANGVASLDAGGKVPVAQLPAGVANGVASLDAGAQVPAAQLGNSPGVPSGTVIDFAGAILQIPAGYLNCDGASYLTATYPALFAAIGYLWGGAGANFSVPPLARRVTVGSSGGGSPYLPDTVGGLGGEETHLLTIPEMPAHTHDVSAYLPGGGQTYSNLAGTLVASNITGSTGGGGAHNIMQPSAVMLKIIKT